MITPGSRWRHTMSDMACLCLWCHVRHGITGDAAARLPCIKTTRVARCRTRNENILSSGPYPAKKHLFLENKPNDKFCTLLGKNSSESFGAYFFAKHALSTQHSTAMSDVCEKIQVLPNVVNKGVQGVLGGTLLFDRFIRRKSDGQWRSGGVCKHFVSYRPILMSWKL